MKAAMAFSVMPFYEMKGLFHDGIIDPGGFLHEALFLRILAGAAVIDRIRGKYRRDTGTLNERDQEAGGPGFIDAQRILHDMLSHKANGIIGITEPDLAVGCFGDGEEMVQKEVCRPSVRIRKAKSRS